MNKYVLKAEKREVLGSKVRKMRKEGLIPATVFGKTVDSISIQISSVEFNRVYKQAGETSLIWISVDGESKERPTLVKDLSNNPLSGKIVHIDFHQVNLKEKVTANVPVEIIGESELIKSGAAVLDIHLDEVEVEALPTDIPEKLVFDISILNQVGDSLLLSSVVLPAGVTLITDIESVVVALGEPQKEEEPLDTAVVETEVVGESEGDKKDETPSETKE
jgi:large subunit ribosomal protein L25